MQDFLSQMYFNNTLLNYLMSLLSFIISIFIIVFFKYVLLKRLNAWAARTVTSLDEYLIRAIKQNLLPLFYFGAFYLSTKSLLIHPTLTKIIEFSALALVAILGASFASTVFMFIFNKYWDKKNKDANREFALKWIASIIKTLIWFIALILFLENIGIRINALIAGFGIGGLALAFAAQAILQDVFSFFTIFFDRPFEIGDFIIVDELMGTVEHIGIKTTRLRSLSGEQLIFANTDLTNSRVRNYKRMENRRVQFSIGVTYDTPLHKLKEIPGLIKNNIDNVQNVIFERAHFFAFADFSLNYEIVYYVTGRDYNKYMDVQQEINFLLKEEFDKKEIEFAFPTQTLHLLSSSPIYSPTHGRTN